MFSEVQSAGDTMQISAVMKGCFLFKYKSLYIHTSFIYCNVCQSCYLTLKHALGTSHTQVGFVK